MQILDAGNYVSQLHLASEENAKWGLPLPLQCESSLTTVMHYLKAKVVSYVF